MDLPFNRTRGTKIKHMYKIKRFSQMTEIQQRQYGLLSDLNHSGIRRSYKKYVGRVRRSVGNLLEEKIIKSDENLRNINNKIYGISKGGSEEVLNPSASRKIIKDNSKRNKVRVMKSNDNDSSFMVHSDEVNDDLLRSMRVSNPNQIKKIENASKSNKSLIFLGRNRKGVDDLAHEMGHAENSVSKNPITRTIHNLSGNKKYLDSSDTDKGLYQIARHAFKNKLVELEETRASKNAVRMMKNAGVKDNQLESAKKNLGLYLDSYKASSKSDNLKVAHRTIQIPSRVR